MFKMNIFFLNMNLNMDVYLKNQVAMTAASGEAADCPVQLTRVNQFN